MANGAAEDEYDFADDDAFDELPADTLHQLEEHAFLSTQAPRTGVSEVPTQEKQRYAAPSSEYDSGIYDEEDVIDLNAEPISLPPAKGLPARSSAYHNKSFRPPSKVISGFQQQPRLPTQGNGALNSEQPGSRPQASQQDRQDEVDIQALLAQVEELRQQNEALQQASRESQTVAQTKVGEAALLRRKIESTSNEYEKRIQRERDAHAQAFKQQKADLEAAIREKRKIEDNNRFLEHEARQAHATAVPRRLAATAQDTSVGRSTNLDQPGTPKRTDKILPFRDGFDDEDVMVVSPSKARLKQTTPKKGGKRKRSVERSPAKPGALDFAEPVGSPSISFGSREDSERTSATVGTGTSDAQGPPDDQHYELLQRLLNYRPLPYTKDRFIEVMAAYTFPSRSDQKLSSFIMGLLQVLPRSVPMEAHVLSVLATIWKKCLDEAYYAPVNVLMLTIHHVMSLHFLSTAARAAQAMVPLITRTVDLVAVPTGLAGKNATELSPEAAKIESQIDIQQSLNLLSYICMACAKTRTEQFDGSEPRGNGEPRIKQELPSTPVPPVESFWRMVQFDFILVLLMRAQPKQAMRTVLSLLPSSCLEDSFGTIIVGSDGKVNQEKQTKCEENTLHRLLDLLFEIPKPLKGREDRAWDDADLANLRLDILAIFRSMCLVQPATRSKQSHGSKLLAQHPRAIGKLFRFLSDSTNLLYTYPPPPLRHFTDQARGGPTPHALTAQAVNTTMRILHHLITSFDEEVDVRQKLGAVPGGPHRHLVALSRLAFSDQIFLDAGVDDGTVDAAHEMLDNYLTYEEGESLVMLFSTPSSKAGNPAGESAQAGAKEGGVAEVADADVRMEAADTTDDGGDEL